MKILCLLFLSLLLLAGCDPIDIPQTIFNDDVCSAPCWNGITPGITTQEEAFTILSGLNAVDQDTLTIIDYSPRFLGSYDSQIAFSFQNNNLYFIFGSVLIIDNIVEYLAFEGNWDFTISEAIDLFGGPEFVSIIPYRGYIIGFLNRENGIFFEYNTWDRQTTIEETIEPGTNLERVVFFDTNIYDTFIEDGLFSQREVSPEEYLKLLTPWNGYGDIWELYMDRQSELDSV